MIRPLSPRLPNPSFLFLALAMTLIPGCGGNAQDSNAGDGDTSGDGDGDTSGDGDGDDICDGFENDSVRHLEIEIKNERSSAIHIGPRISTCGTLPPFEVADTEGLLRTNLNNCTPHCKNYIDGEGLGCPAICIYPEIITIEPGESHLAIWDTRYGESLELPAECNAADVVATTCVRARAIDPGTFTFFAHAGTSLTCDSPCDDCGPDGDGCVGQLVVSGDELSAESTVDLDESYGIVPVTRGDDAPVPGAINSVELVFVE